MVGKLFAVNQKIQSGTVDEAAIGKGIIRASATSGADWEDGNCGNSEWIVFTAADFMNNNNIQLASGLTTYIAESAAVGANLSPVVYNSSATGSTIANKNYTKRIYY